MRRRLAQWLRRQADRIDPSLRTMILTDSPLGYWHSYTTTTGSRGVPIRVTYHTIGGTDGEE